MYVRALDDALVVSLIFVYIAINFPSKLRGMSFVARFPRVAIVECLFLFAELHAQASCCRQQLPTCLRHPITESIETFF